MDILVAKSVGSGKTTLSAFDNALYRAGIANYNLLRLSSVIPPGSNILTGDAVKEFKMPGQWGDRLYIVMAEMSASTQGQEAWAGIGWVQDPETKQGLFVEHEGYHEASVRSDIEKSLTDLMKTRGIDYGPINMQIIGSRCQSDPVCSMVIAVYQSSDWNNGHSFPQRSGNGG